MNLGNMFQIYVRLRQIFIKFAIFREYFDEKFHSFNEEVDGIFARVFQHEHDHLNGILFIDHLSPLKKNVVNRKLENIQKGKFEELYPTIKNKKWVI